MKIRNHIAFYRWMKAYAGNESELARLEYAEESASRADAIISDHVPIPRAIETIFGGWLRETHPTEIEFLVTCWLEGPELKKYFTPLKPSGRRTNGRFKKIGS